jgi:predicted transcriptional regulator
MMPVAPRYLTDKDEEFASLLISAGIRRNVARVLVYLSSQKEATSREIERITDLRQPEVSMAMGWMAYRGWTESRESRAENRGRPVKFYRLAMPLAKIMDTIEKEKVNEAREQLLLLQKLRDYIPAQSTG